ncbi:hypothetical protein [Cohnella pontilimi]|nr:hypothetical protein [Cohnella pontilimi]
MCGGLYLSPHILRQLKQLSSAASINGIIEDDKAEPIELGKEERHKLT